MTDAKKRILVIEDEKMLADGLRKKLEAEGFEVGASTDGKEGYDLAIKTHPDLILLDLVLPTMDGVTILTELRKNGWGKSVPIIILTNLSRSDLVEKSMKEGASTYLVKTDWKINDVIEKVKYELGVV